MRKRCFFALLILTATAAGITYDISAQADIDSTDVDSIGADSVRITAVEKRVLPIVRRSCSVSGCHQGERPKAGLDLSAGDLRPALLNVASVQVKEAMLIDAKAPDRSYLLKKIRGGEGIKGRKMPVGDVPGVSEAEIVLIAEWVQGFGKIGINDKTR